MSLVTHTHTHTTTTTQICTGCVRTGSLKTFIRKAVDGVHGDKIRIMRGPNSTSSMDNTDHSNGNRGPNSTSSMDNTDHSNGNRGSSKVILKQAPSLKSVGSTIIALNQLHKEKQQNKKILQTI